MAGNGPEWITGIMGIWDTRMIHQDIYISYISDEIVDCVSDLQGHCLDAAL